MDLDITFLFQFGILLTLVAFLSRFLLKPFQQVLDARDAQIRGNQDEAQELRRIGDAEMEKYQAQLRAAQAEAFAAQQKAREAGRAAERNILAQTRDDIAAKVNRGRAGIASDESVARAELAQQTEQLAGRMVERILGRELGAREGRGVREGRGART